MRPTTLSTKATPALATLLAGLALAMSVTGISVGSAGCSVRIGGGGTSDAAQARAKAAELEEEARALRLELAEARALAARTSTTDATILAATPALAGIEIDRLSGLSSSQPLAQGVTIPVHVRTLDGRGRFLQAVGTLEVDAWALSDRRPDADSEAPPTMGRVEPPPGALALGRVTLSALEVREAYRSSVTGTYYEALVVATAPEQPMRSAMLIRVRLTDALTGQVHDAARVIPAR
jgi:hypothetical protein